MYDHLNSGILNGGRVGPGLNIGRVEGFPCFDLLASAIKRIHKNINAESLYFFIINKTISFYFVTYRND